MSTRERAEDVAIISFMSPNERFAGRNCIDPSAPAALAPLCTPGRVDSPLSDSIVPLAARTVHGRPGHVGHTCIAIEGCPRFPA